MSFSYPEILQILAPAAELIKRQADRTDIPFTAVIQAELLALMMSFITPGCRWYPQTLLYSSRRPGFPFFIRAAQHRNFSNLAQITGITDADALRDAVRKGQERLEVNRRDHFKLGDVSFWACMNMAVLRRIIGVVRSRCNDEPTRRRPISTHRWYSDRGLAGSTREQE